MKCHFVDDRSAFVSILAEKLGPEFQLSTPTDLADDDAICADVTIVRLPALSDADFQVWLARLQKQVRIPNGAPVLAFMGTPDKQVMRIALAAGAYDCVVETSPMEELRIVLRRAAEFHQLSSEVRALRAQRHHSGEFSAMVGNDARMHTVFSLASRIAPTNTTVLLTGESGTGKELLAQAIHQASPRAGRPFLAVACSALPENLIEDELFGHERGAFTGATSLRRGRFEAAECGTIFLDEIGELSPALQVKLLRVLQERTFERLGSNQPRPMEARVICATNCDLKRMVQTGAFRLDLYYRLNTVEIRLPALRERRDDIVVLAYSFLETYAAQHNRPIVRIGTAAMAALQEHDWPGNVRELQNVMERAVLVCDGHEICLEHLPVEFGVLFEPISEASFDEEVRNFKRRLIQRSLLVNDNNKLQTARQLKIARSSLHRLIDELRISIPSEQIH